MNTKNIKFNYVYRDGANYKSWGVVIFANPDELTLDEINSSLVNAFLVDGLFIANQISVPEKFLFLDGKFTKFDHCYHEFHTVEISEEQSTDSLNRSITDFLKEVELVSQNSWKAFDILDRA